MTLFEQNPEKKRAKRYLTREKKGQQAFPGLEAPKTEKKRRGARESAQKKLNRVPGWSKGKER